MPCIFRSILLQIVFVRPYDVGNWSAGGLLELTGFRCTSNRILTRLSNTTLKMSQAIQQLTPELGIKD